MTTKNKVFEMLDIPDMLVAAYKNAKKEKVDTGPKYSKFPVSSGSKFKIHIPSSIKSKGLEELIEEHFVNNFVSIERFSNLSGEVVWKGNRYFISLNVTDLGTRSVIDGVITPL